MKINEHSAIPDIYVSDACNREACLWLGVNACNKVEDPKIIADLISLPWKAVICESPIAKIVAAIEEAKGRAQFSRQRGFLYLISSDPDHLGQLPPRSLPIYFLNGRSDSVDPQEKSNLRGHAALRRRLNMLAEVKRMSPKSVTVVIDEDDDLVSDLKALWQEGFRVFINAVVSSEIEKNSITNWSDEESSPQSIDVISSTIECFAPDFISRVETLLDKDDGRILIRVLELDREIRIVDVATAENIERPVLDRFELLKVSDLNTLQPEDLNATDFSLFFETTQTHWRPYAAGLPWTRDRDATDRVIKRLKKATRLGPEENALFFVPTQPGAGGTTFSRQIAFAAAAAGFPTLVANQSDFRPDPIELSSFLYRCSQVIAAENESNQSQSERRSSSETAWLLVFDTVHWDGHESLLRRFLQELRRSGRRVVVVWISASVVSDEIRLLGKAIELSRLTHTMSERDALALGEHLNRYLAPIGKARTPQQWRNFVDAHCAINDASIATFWVALEFWLKGQLDISESVQSWMYRSFKESDVPKVVKLNILRVAAFSIHKQPVPEAALLIDITSTVPLVIALEEAREHMPALGIVPVSTGSQRQWVLAHDILGRYLINALFYDRPTLEELGFGDVNDPISLRLSLIQELAAQSSMGNRYLREFAIEIAVRILKLDTDGNPEYIRYWDRVIEILEGMPAAIRETSRTFNHHVAVSRRRIATTEDIFTLSCEQKGEQLRRAIAEIEFALTLPESREEESNLNLYNSLALAYQNLADHEISIGSEDGIVSELRRRADDATREALNEDPTNSYVLETTARNLLQHAALANGAAAVSAAQALSYIFQAMVLNRAELRQGPLSRLAERAINLLREESARGEVDALCVSGNPLGFLAKAWILLAEGAGTFREDVVDNPPIESLEAALHVLEGSTVGSHWLILRFRYDLVSKAYPGDFQKQVTLLDELRGTAYKFPLQLELEYAILLYQANRNHEANLLFKELRPRVKESSSVIVVPERLRWLQSGSLAKTCEARVLDGIGARAMARVRDLDNADVPFIPQEFGQGNIPAGSMFRCKITFGAMGPFIKPVTDI